MTAVESHEERISVLEMHHECEEQRRIAHANQTAGFIVGVLWTVALFYILRRS